MKKILTSLAALLCLVQGPIYAQHESRNWFFGNNAALSFAGASPVALAGSSMVTYEAAASVSDPAGNLLFYTNCVNIWNRNHQLMTNGQTIGGHESATQGAVIVRRPGSASQYFVFAVDGCDNQLVGGLKYSVVDMTQQGGLGSVTSRANQLSTVSLTEKLTAVRHANGRDTWVLVHGWQTDAFLAYLVSPAGVSTTPVITNIGSIHTGGGGSFGNANAVGYMKASPVGNKLALAQRDSRFELFDFNNATGQLSNFVPLTQDYRSYGVEFSPDGSRLYGTTLDGNKIYQFNLLAGSAAAIAASATQVGTTPSFSMYAGALQLGPDGKIYVALHNSSYLGMIASPNTLGTACAYNSTGPSLGGRLSQLGLPNFPNAFGATVLGTASAPLSVQTALYPNPTQGSNKLLVSLPVPLRQQTVIVTLLDALGTTVAHYRMTAAQLQADPLALPLPALAKGAYTVQIAGQAGTVNKKLIVE
ncbi:Por secretion system C-terminal sorting domain-containing protein [Hymenobacter daecheongensis DSM 21074]|uniref:Por secretion system C-terminal sorting domain-containing protein n=1 Tax=Hymenobacter daecheongensis DSM 21074 TaxID=1121955 RepID=A0A1M6EHU4_9BACT|nr:T9SS type A sorting domain-containing protein [Hymenobacter daecheongensis]SHI84969.1 Por secretion system C-terminal sorting domain-containing protein [Hymenobacter daecheongensis DSM 21074]